MTDLDSATAATGSRTDRPRLHAAPAALCITQITGWGVLYYAFPVLAPRIAADTGWSLPATTAAFSAALITAALIGIPVGRILDRHGPRAVMTSGSILGAASALGIAASPNLPLFITAWLCAGTAMATVFYQPAFAALTRWYGPDRIRALTTLTLAGGLASTAFAPLTPSATMSAVPLVPRAPDFAGPAVQGRKGARFLYLTWGGVADDGGFTTFRRAKLLLADIPVADLLKAVASGAAVETDVSLTGTDGTAVCGSVRPPHVGWRLSTVSPYGGVPGSQRVR